MKFLIGSFALWKKLLGCWVLLLYFIMSAHYVLVQGAVGKIYGNRNLPSIYAWAILATVHPLLIKAPVTFDEITYSFTHIVDTRSTDIGRHLVE